MPTFPNAFPRSKSTGNHGDKELDDLPAAFHKAMRVQCDIEEALELSGLATVRANVPHVRPRFWGPLAPTPSQRIIQDDCARHVIPRLCPPPLFLSALCLPDAHFFLRLRPCSCLHSWVPREQRWRFKHPPRILGNPLGRRRRGARAAAPPPLPTQRIRRSAEVRLPRRT